MKFLTGFIVFLSSLTLAQGTISGTLYAPDVKGFIIIGCLLDLATQDCNYDKSPYITIEQSGTSSAYSLPNAPAGNYLVIAWKDTNGNGQLEDDGSDEIAYYMDASGEPTLISAPATNITLALNATATQPATTNPLTTNPESTPSTQSPNSNTIVGIWYRGYASSTSYRDTITGASAPPTGGGWNYTFNADGSYVYNFLLQNTFYSCTTTISNYREGSYVLQDNVLMLTPTQNHTESKDTCTESSNYEKDIPLETEYFLVQFGRHVFMDTDLGETLELTDLILNAQGELEVDPEDSEPLPFSREQ